jgi:hypothetical protein
MTQGLQYSVCRVQHDNPWLEAMLAEVELGQVQPQPGGAAVRDGDGYLEQLAERSQDERRRAELSGDSAAAVPTGAAGSPGATGKGDAAEEAAAAPLGLPSHVVRSAGGAEVVEALLRQTGGRALVKREATKQ